MPESSRIWRMLLPFYVIIHLTATHWPNLRLGGTVFSDWGSWLPGDGSWYLHLGAYVVLTNVVLAALPNWRSGLRLALLILGLLLFAAIDESTQAFIPGRTPTVADFLFNSLGIAIGVTLWKSVGWIGRKSHERRVASGEK